MALASATREELHLAQEGVERVVREVGHASVATRWLVMAFRRVIDAKEVVEDRPGIGRAVPGLASGNEQDDHAATATRTLRRLHREREAPAVAEVQAADGRLQRSCETIGTEV